VHDHENIFTFVKINHPLLAVDKENHYIRKHGSISGVKYIERYREIYDAQEATVYLYASRRDASTWDFYI